MDQRLDGCFQLQFIHLVATAQTQHFVDAARVQHEVAQLSAAGIAAGAFRLGLDDMHDFADRFVDLEQGNKCIGQIEPTFKRPVFYKSFQLFLFPLTFIHCHTQTFLYVLCSTRAEQVCVNDAARRNAERKKIRKAELNS